MEIERKWLVDYTKLPEEESSEIWEVVQGYLNSVKDEWVIRVRSINDNKFFLELKTSGHLSREELRFEINRTEFYSTLRECKGIVKKTRHTYYENNVKYEIDFYEDYEFITCEVEFNSEEEANKFIAPDWCVKDVTYDPKYKNVNLAK